MHRLRSEFHGAEITDATRAVLTLEIALDDQLAVSQHDEPVNVPDSLFGNGMVETPRHVGGESDILRGKRAPRRLLRSDRHRG